MQTMHLRLLGTLKAASSCEYKNMLHILFKLKCTPVVTAQTMILI